MRVVEGENGVGLGTFTLFLLPYEHISFSRNLINSLVTWNAKWINQMAKKEVIDVLRKGKSELLSLIEAKGRFR